MPAFSGHEWLLCFQETCMVEQEAVEGKITHGFGWPHMVLNDHTWFRKARKAHDACDNVSECAKHYDCGVHPETFWLF